MKNSIVASIAIAVGLALGWGIYHTPAPKPEPAAPEIRQKDGSLVLERAPSGLKAGAPGGSIPLKPAQEIPKGAKVERIVQVTVQPKAVELPAGLPGGRPTIAGAVGEAPEGHSAQPCPPVTIDLSLVRMPDKTQRVLASSPDGSVIGGIDVPIQAQAIPRIQRWTAAALVGYDTHAGRNVFGGQATYSRGPFVVTGGVIGGTGFAGVGIKF